MFEILTFVLGLIGTAGTVVGGVRAFLASRRNLVVKVIDYSRINRSTLFFVDIRNRSSAPIAISRVDLIADPAPVPCELLSKKIRESGGILYRTPLFPLNIAPQTSCLYFLEFLDAPRISLVSGTSVSFSFDTNRGMIKKTVSLPAEGRYLHIE